MVKHIASSAKKNSGGEEIIDIEDVIGKNRKLHSSKTVSELHEFYLIGEIKDAEHYVDWFRVIRNASEVDVVKIYINSQGGDLFTALQLRRCMSESSAQIVISVEGMCMSAATIILLSGNDFEISPNCLFMLHNYTSGTFGRGNHMRDQLKAESTWAESMFKDIYTGFLSSEEVTAMIEGKDYWFESEEVCKRLTAWMKHHRPAKEEESTDK